MKVDKSLKKKVSNTGPFATYEECPFVVLAEHIKKQSWMTKEDNVYVTGTKSQFASSGHPPKKLHITKKYKQQDIEIIVEWSDQFKNFATTLNNPYTQLYKNGRKSFHSKTYSGVLERCQEAMNDAMPEVEKREANQIEREEISARIKQEASMIVSGIEIPLQMQCEGREIHFNINGQHRCRINLPDNFTSGCYQFTVYGQYQLSEIKQMIETIASGPSYAVERLTRSCSK